MTKCLRLNANCCFNRQTPGRLGQRATLKIDVTNLALHMFERIAMVFNAMVNALLGKVEDPQMMLEITYMELQSSLIAVRQELASALATETQLQEQIKTLENTNAPTEDLKEQLKQLQTKIAKLRSRLFDLENEIHKAYTKRQIFIARDKASGAALVCEEILVGKAITENGATFDREIAPDPPYRPMDFPAWIVPTITLLLVTIMGFLAYSHLYR